MSCTKQRKKTKHYNYPDGTIMVQLNDGGTVYIDNSKDPLDAIRVITPIPLVIVKMEAVGTKETNDPVIYQ